MNHYIRQQNSSRQDNYTGSPINVLKNVHDLENLDREIPYSFLHKKAQKLATAVYLVTGFLSDTEPIKWQVRESGLSILSDVISVTDFHLSDTVHRIKNVSSGIEKIISLFEIAATAGFMSDMNLAILKEEYSSLVRIIESQKLGKPEDGYTFSREFFSTPETASLTPSGKEKFFYKEQNKKDTNIATEESEGQRLGKIFRPSQGNNVSDISQKIVTQKRVEKTSRRDIILHIIKDRGDGAAVSIKDIAGNFSDCGEKTIQRELTVLVAEGVLKKTGERRWSRYSLQVV